VDEGAGARRNLNESRRRLFGADRERMIAFVCECGDPDCRRSVLLTPEQYEERRGGPIVHAEHGELGPFAVLQPETPHDSR
jgi:hypothetical protein